jgi:hypothetical protein
MQFNPEPFKEIECLTIYKETKYYYLHDNIHIKEIFNINNDILCVYNLNKIKESFKDNYIDYMYTSKLTINNLIYNVDLKYITINEKSNELFVYYIVINI